MRHLQISAAVLFSCLSGCATPEADVDDVRIDYTDASSGDHALVFVRGWVCDSTNRSEQVSQLTHPGRLIAIDLSGHGQSDKRDPEYSMACWARSVNAVLESAGVKKAILIGHGNGVPVVRQSYRDYPDKTLALVTVDGPLLQMETGTPRQLMVGGLRATVDDDVRRPGRILVPVLMVNAKQPSWNQSYKDRGRVLVPNLEYHELGGVDHWLMMDEPDEFNALLQEFVAELE